MKTSNQFSFKMKDLREVKLKKGLVRRALIILDNLEKNMPKLQPIPLKLLGDKLALEFNEEPTRTKNGLHIVATDTINNVREATIRFIGNKMSDAALSIGNVVMVRISDCQGPIIKFNGSSLRLYNTQDVLCVVSDK